MSSLAIGPVSQYEIFSARIQKSRYLLMAERKLEELYPRAPRYEIDLGDNQVVRFAHMPKGSKTMHTRILNLSESGMAFLVPYLTAPEMGEKIKVEFTAPNSEPIACFAKVVRVEIHKTYHNNRKPQTFKLVAVEFENVHPKQRQMLSTGLQKQIVQKQKEYQRDQAWNRMVWFFIDFWNGLGRLLSRVFKKPPVEKNSDDTSYIDV